jgi:hypothetical protein
VPETTSTLRIVGEAKRSGRQELRAARRRRCRHEPFYPIPIIFLSESQYGGPDDRKPQVPRRYGVMMDEGEKCRVKRKKRCWWCWLSSQVDNDTGWAVHFPCRAPPGRYVGTALALSQISENRLT